MSVLTEKGNKTKTHQSVGMFIMKKWTLYFHELYVYDYVSLFSNLRRYKICHIQ